MEAAKKAVQDFTSLRGHRTEVDERVQPAITSETIKPHRHEEATTALKKEVHQHGYHTTVQPIQHKETLPEDHSHRMMDVEKREFNHDNERETQLRVQNELGQFKDSSVTEATRHSRSEGQTVEGEHVFHHIHETVQPVVHKETIQPTVVHTTVPIHEVHHNEAQHHGISQLPMKTLEEFKSAGGALTGGKSTSQEVYDGPPRPYNESLKTTIKDVLGGRTERSDSGVGVGGETMSSMRGATTSTGRGFDSELGGRGATTTASRGLDSDLGGRGATTTASRGLDSDLGGRGATSDSRRY